MKQYSIDPKELASEGADYDKYKAVMAKQRFRWFPGGTVGGAVGAHVMGLPWGLGAGAGLLAQSLFGGESPTNLLEPSKESPFHNIGSQRAAEIARGFRSLEDEGLPTIAARKGALKAQRK